MSSVYQQDTNQSPASSTCISFFCMDIFHLLSAPLTISPTWACSGPTTHDSGATNYTLQN